MLASPIVRLIHVTKRKVRAMLWPCHITGKLGNAGQNGARTEGCYTPRPLFSSCQLASLMQGFKVYFDYLSAYCESHIEIIFVETMGFSPPGSTTGLCIDENSLQNLCLDHQLITASNHCIESV